MEYAAKLHEGVSYTIAALAKLLIEVQYDANTKSAAFDGKVIQLKSGESGGAAYRGRCEAPG